MYISHLQFEYWLKQFYLSEDPLRSLHLIYLSWSYLCSSPTSPILQNTGPYLLWAQHQSWSQSPSEHLTTSNTSEHPTTPNIQTTPKSYSSMNLTLNHGNWLTCACQVTQLWCHKGQLTLSQNSDKGMWPLKRHVIIFLAISLDKILSMKHPGWDSSMWFSHLTHEQVSEILLAALLLDRRPCRLVIPFPKGIKGAPFCLE